MVPVTTAPGPEGVGTAAEAVGDGSVTVVGELPQPQARMADAVTNMAKEHLRMATSPQIRKTGDVRTRNGKRRTVRLTDGQDRIHSCSNNLNQARSFGFRQGALKLFGCE